ncbi:sporulation peptidase YabG [Bacillus fonticola]|uniref:sporulation peptidase YabG n=1 Tax=Bacillus fonticola TaxID=2728853 RepID=UPI0014741B76|nr:sporulation peptidase YabG [Bacillus fonticola]
MAIQVGSIVGRRSYGCDVLFRVIEIRESQGQTMAILKGEEMRLLADADVRDLDPLQEQYKQERREKTRSLEKQSLALFQQDLEYIRERHEYDVTNAYEEEVAYFSLPGKVLHIDGDPTYLQKCVSLYQEVGVPVYGVHCQETEMPYRIESLLAKYQPDILVITGHDAYSKSKGKKTDINAYRHSRHFVETVQKARGKCPSLDQLIIFAGACQSHFESIIQAGANFASSPSRVNIHALDPVYIVSKISFTPFTQPVHVWDVLRNTLTGEKGLGGIETKGVLRTGMPYQPHDEESPG